jgi:hypothetical protein
VVTFCSFFNNSSAPPGPIFMAEYKNASQQESAKLGEDARSYFEKGVSMRETGDRYVKVTGLLATVLLLTTLSQRFQIFGPRVAVVAIALALLITVTCCLLYGNHSFVTRATGLKHFPADVVNTADPGRIKSKNDSRL